MQLKMVVEEGKRKEMMETERQKYEIEVEIAEVGEKIRERGRVGEVGE